MDLIEGRLAEIFKLEDKADLMRAHRSIAHSLKIKIVGVRDPVRCAAA